MRTRTFLVGATSLLLGLGAASDAAAQVLLMKGSDTLEDITRDAITACGLGGSINYVGGGSTGGQAAMVAVPPTQQISPMSRELNGTGCVAGASQELIGLDGMAILGANQTGGDSTAETADPANDCSDGIKGGIVLPVPGCTAAEGCDVSVTPPTYTFTDWKDVIAQVYGGQNHTTATQLLPSGNLCPNGNADCTIAGQVCVGSGATARCGVLAERFFRNPNRINCNGAVRRALVNSWGSLFQDTAGGGSTCRTGGCTRLRHAFRRDDISGTTDTFVTLVGLLAIPAYTAAFDTTVSGIQINLPKPDGNARPSPFCNGGSALQNKGDSDYLDLDPIRRSVDHDATDPVNRPGLEMIGQGSPSRGGNNADANCEPADGDSTVAGVQPKLPPTESASSTQPGILPVQVVVGGAIDPASTVRLREELGYNAATLSAFVKPTTRQCLGLVQSIAMPGNYTTEQAYWGANAAGTVAPVPCTQTGGAPDMRFVIADTQHSSTALCPDGKAQPCRLPVSRAIGTNNFNCYTNGVNPTILPLGDNRKFNLHVLQANGQYLRDNYVNPNIPTTLTNGLACVADAECGNGTCMANLCANDTRPTISAVRQNRVVSGFFRIHSIRPTTLNGSVPTLPAGTACRTLSATNQIGCLVKASACSIGFAGREAVDPLAIGDNLAFRIQDFQPSTANIQALVLTAVRTDDYPISRTLWVNSVKGFANVTGSEATLVSCFQDNNPGGGPMTGTIDGIVAGRNFTVVPAGVTRTRACPAGL